ncbi:8246_t:CDS:2 [Rhizophagus irregularis]|nr:8246_t:CDS:2 [Rhizophagus irregularis]
MQDPRINSKEPLENKESRWIGLYKLEYSDPKGNKRFWEIAERKTRGSSELDAVGIVSLLKSKNNESTQIILCLQFRPSINKMSVEFPAGLVDREETPEKAALRELEEETGYHGKIVSSYYTMYSNVGMTNTNNKLIFVESKEIAKFGIKLEESLIDKKFRESFRSIYKLYPNYGYDSKLSPKEWWTKVIEKTFIEAGVDKQNLSLILPTLSTNLYNKFTTSETYELYDDTVHVLNELHNNRKIKLGVISNLDERIENIFSSLNIRQYFNFILLSGKFGIEKPDARIFEKAIELGEINTTNKEERRKQILHVGDDKVRDYQGAKNVGISTLLIKRIEDTKSENTIYNNEKNQRDDIIHSLSEIFNYIG